MTGLPPVVKDVAVSVGSAVDTPLVFLTMSGTDCPVVHALTPLTTESTLVL
jgi:hypothetical protein